MESISKLKHVFLRLVYFNVDALLIIESDQPENEIRISSHQSLILCFNKDVKVLFFYLEKFILDIFLIL